MSDRPSGVTFLGVINIIGGISGLSSVLRPSPFTGDLAVIFLIFSLAMAVLNIVTGAGLLNLKNWARIMTIIFTLLGMVLSPIMLLLIPPPYGGAYGGAIIAILIILIAAVFIIEIIIVWYLTREDIKSYFE